MDYQVLNLEIRNQVAWITINRPKAFNAINLQACKELLDIANRLGSDRQVRAAVLTGAGDQAFCAGGDVAGFAENPDKVELLIKEMTTYLHSAIARLARMNAPLIARVNGVAAGAGLSLSACTDLAICTDQAKFTSAYTKIGLTPDGSSTYFLSRIIGIRRAADLYLTNRTLNAQEALEWGLVNRVVSADKLDETVTELAEQLAKGPTLAHGGVKKLLQMALNDSLDSQMERETRCIVAMSTSADGIEGVKAFVEKRKPNFTGQ
ncbi:MAG: enoyl-CoA hydratase-related protein [Burkholderiaceae bacterium]